LLDDRLRFNPLEAGEERRRWTQTDVGMTIWSRRYRDCDRCDGQADVVSGSISRGIVDRQLSCLCGRTWRQIIY
jgi:hypothetical protein